MAVRIQQLLRLLLILRQQFLFYLLHHHIVRVVRFQLLQAVEILMHGLPELV